MGALGIYAVGQLVWNLQTLGGGHSFPAFSDVFYLTTGPLMSWTLYQSWCRRPGVRHTRGIHLDAALMTLGILVLCLAFYLPHQSGWNWFQIAVMLAYPGTLFAAFSLGLVLALNDPGPVLPGRMVTLGALFGLAFSWMAWNMSLLLGTAANGSLVNLSFSLLLLALGGSVGTWSWSRRTGARGWKAGVLVLLPLVGPVAGALSLVMAVANPLMPREFQPLFAGLAALLLVLSLVRQGTLFREIKEAHVQRERNSELEDALERLHRTQDQLVQSAKLTALGQLIAGITHDLNSPLGAIRSSSALLQTVLKERHQDAVNRPFLDAHQNATYQKLSQALSPEAPFLDSRAERALRRQILDRAAGSGCPQPERVASALLEAGLADRMDLVDELLTLTDPGPVLDLFETQATAHRLASVILQATDRASNVVVTLQNFLRSGTEREKQWVLVVDSIQAVLPLFQHKVKRGLKLTTSFLGEPVVLAWPDKLSQVWVNLITNAVQAVGDQGAIDITVKVLDQVLVSVADNGPGVPAEVRDRIFEAFFTTKAIGEGTGLGLDVCRRVVEELGGTIRFESEPGRTVFEVRLPRADGLEGS